MGGRQFFEKWLAGQNLAFPKGERRQGWFGGGEEGLVSGSEIGTIVATGVDAIGWGGEEGGGLEA